MSSNLADGDALNASLRVGLAIEAAGGIAADKQAVIIRLQNELANLRAQQSAPVRKSDADFDLTLALRDVELLKDKLILKDQTIREKNAMLLDWRHSNDTFKTLAVKYGTRLGLTTEEMIKEFFEAAIELAIEDQSFKDSKVFSNAKERLEMKTGS
jgi:hypothetical protein